MLCENGDVLLKHYLTTLIWHLVNYFKKMKVTSLNIDILEKVGLANE